MEIVFEPEDEEFVFEADDSGLTIIFEPLLPAEGDTVSPDAKEPDS